MNLFGGVEVGEVVCLTARKGGGLDEDYALVFIGREGSRTRALGQGCFCGIGGIGMSGW